MHTWVSFTQSGPPGPTGDYGPPGKVIIGDNPPTEYPAVGDNQLLDLLSLVTCGGILTTPCCLSTTLTTLVLSGSLFLRLVLLVLLVLQVITLDYRGVWTDPIGVPPDPIYAKTFGSGMVEIMLL